MAQKLPMDMIDLLFLAQDGFAARQKEDDDAALSRTCHASRFGRQRCLDDDGASLAGFRHGHYAQGIALTVG